jgi:peptide/nickel transport system ATP-binding protein
VYEILLDIKNLKMFYRLKKGFIKAVDDVSLNIRKGQTVGIVGESGCGKTSLAFSIMRLLPRNAQLMAGNIFLDGQDILAMSDEEVVNIRGTKVSMISQGAINALNPVMKVGDQVIETILAHEKIEEAKAEERVKKMFDSVGLTPSTMYKYPHELSGGMKQRVMIAMALVCNPKLVIADEPTTALDVIVQDQVLDEIRRLQEKLKIAMIIITHDVTLVAEICDSIYVMYAGKIVERGETIDVFENPAHPYTHGLLNSVPSILGRLDHLEPLPGNPPDLMNPPLYCRFLPRCLYANKFCFDSIPEAIEVKKGHISYCHNAGKFLRE